MLLRYNQIILLILFFLTEIQGMRWWLQGTLEVIPMYNMMIEERDIRLGVEELFEKDYFNLFDFNPQLHLNVTRQPKAEMQQFLVVFEFEGIQK